MPPKQSIVQGGQNFPPTRWSVVAAARSDDSAERARALDVLFAAYWKPVYKYIRLNADSFVLNQIKHAGRQKRGGAALHLALDFSVAEGELYGQTIDPASIPSEEKFEEFFEKEWIR